MAVEKLRVGIIGIGWYALTRHVPRLRETGNAEVVAISRRNVEALADAKKAADVEDAYTDWRELVERSDLNAVIVSTAHHAHVEPTLAALERGLHVLVEKPMALAGKDAWAMVRAAERADRVLMVGYNARCMGGWRATARTLQEGTLGTVRQVNLAVSYNLRFLWEVDRVPAAMLESFRASGVPDSFFDGGNLVRNWRRNPAKMGGGEFADWGSHWVDLALWLAGAPAVEVVAFAESAGMPVDCFLNIQARLANDVLLSLTSADGIPANRNRLTLYGDLGVLTADWAGWGSPEIRIYRATGAEDLEIDIPGTTPTAAFVGTILNGAPNLAPAQVGAHAVAFTEAAYRSVAEAQIVRLSNP